MLEYYVQRLFVCYFQGTRSCMENYPKVDDIINLNPAQADLIALGALVLWVKTVIFFLIFQNE